MSKKQAARDTKDAARKLRSAENELENEIQASHLGDLAEEAELTGEELADQAENE